MGILIKNRICQPCFNLLDKENFMSIIFQFPLKQFFCVHYQTLLIFQISRVLLQGTC